MTPPQTTRGEGLTVVPHPLDGASLIDVLDYAARRIGEAKDAAGDLREWRLALDRFDEAYMWIVAAVHSTPTPDAKERE